MRRSFSTPPRTWFVDELDLADVLNGAIWTESLALGARLSGARRDAIAGALQDRNLDGQGSLPWVPDMVGSRWHEAGQVLVVGSAYADFFTPAAKRLRRMSIEVYRQAKTASAFLRSFLDTVVRGDQDYYERIGMLLDGFTTPDLVTLTDLCRATFVRFDGKTEAGDPSVNSALEDFRAYVDAGQRWTEARITERRCAIVALGDLAGRELVRVLVTKLSCRLESPNGSLYRNGKSYARTASRRCDWFWAVREDGFRRPIIVAYHPSNQNRNDKSYLWSRAALREALEAKP